MKRKHLLFLTSLIALAACTDTSTSSQSSSSNETSSPVSSSIETSSSSSSAPQLKYEVVDGEVVINDLSLTSSSDIALDNNKRVFYEIFTGSFSDSNKDGIGDLQGIINRLDYLNDGNVNSGKSLGVQGIWLTPIFESPTYHKYDVSNYYKIDPQFGDMETLQKLIDECHKRNIKIILDLVLNHTGYLNPWFNQFKYAHTNNDPTNPYYDFYTYYREGETKPSGREFSKLNGTNIYYECNFSTSMPELNFDNPIVREQVLEIAKYYLDMGIDGFRFDAAKYVYYNEHDKSAEFWGWYVKELKKINPNVYTVGEVWDADSVTDKYFEKGLGCFNFSTSGSGGKIAMSAESRSDVNVYSKYVRSYYDKIQSLDKDAMMYSFITNHDMDRAAGFLTLDNYEAHMGASLQILSPGSPFIYYGDEIGIKGTRGSANSDANRRLRMLWGDKDTVLDPSEATFKESYQINGTVKTQIGDEKSLLIHYKKLIMIRNAYPEIYNGDFIPLKSISESGDIGGFLFTLNDSNVCVVHNTSKEEAITFDISKLSDVTLSSLEVYAGKGEAKLNGTTLTIDPMTSVVLK